MSRNRQTAAIIGFFRKTKVARNLPYQGTVPIFETKSRPRLRGGFEFTRRANERNTLTRRASAAIANQSEEPKRASGEREAR